MPPRGAQRLVRGGGDELSQRYGEVPAATNPAVRDVTISTAPTRRRRRGRAGSRWCVDTRFSPTAIIAGPVARQLAHGVDVEAPSSRRTPYATTEARRRSSRAASRQVASVREIIARSYAPGELREVNRIGLRPNAAARWRGRRRLAPARSIAAAHHVDEFAAYVAPPG
jgi:hypothetical protein